MRKYNLDNKKNNITKNLKVIEWLKNELLSSVSHLFRIMIDGKQDKLVDSIANLIISAYLLAKRLGISPDRIERKMKDNLRKNIDQQHQIEEWYNDLSLLLKHIMKKRK